MVKLVGILNVTPDSFSDGGQFNTPEAALQRAEQLFAEGASLVDVGAESTRPNATVLSDDEEWHRLEPILGILLERYPGKISLDTYHPATVRRAFELGSVVVNDVTGMNNPDMVATVLELGATCIVSHSPALDIQLAHKQTPVTTVERVVEDLLAKEALLRNGGLKFEQIILDPGIGFGKTMELNCRLLRFAKEVPERTVMIGYSRKRFLGEHRLELAPNLEAGRIAAAAGASYLRVHDVKGHQELLDQSL